MTPTQPTAEQLRLAREYAETIGPFKLKYKQTENYSGEHREWNEYLTVPQGCPDIVEAAVPAIALAIQAPEARMAEAVEVERERLIGQVSVDIEIALNKAGVLLTEAQGYIAAEAAIDAIRSQSNG